MGACFMSASWNQSYLIGDALEDLEVLPDRCSRGRSARDRPGLLDISAKLRLGHEGIRVSCVPAYLDLWTEVRVEHH